LTGEYLGLDPYAADMMSWGIFEAVLTPGDLILLLSWKDEATALKYGSAIVESIKTHELAAYASYATIRLRHHVSRAS